MAHKNVLHEWLRDAHGMEKALGDYVERSIDDFKDNTAVQENLRSIHEQNTTTIKTLDNLLRERDDSPSTRKDFIGGALGYLSGAGSSAYHDDAIKNILVIHAIFHFAHACYISLAEGATVAEDEELATICTKLADERKHTAEWAEELIPSMTERALLVKE